VSGTSSGTSRRASCGELESPLSVRTATRARQRLNAAAGRTLLTHRHLEPLLAAYGALRVRGVTGPVADRIVLASLERAESTSGKPWKGLTRLYDVLVYSGLDPRSPQWPVRFEEAMTTGVDYTHVPGREWIVRDYQVGKRLMQIDGKIAPGDRWAGLQQGRGSLATGYLRGGHERTEFGRRYSKPLAAFLDSMVVAEGPDHQRHRKAFLPFFTPAAVLAHAPFVEATVASLLNDAMRVAQANRGAFDVRRDVAYQFPIRVICRVLALPAEDVPRVQHWAEAAVRAMDTDAGLSFETTIAGQRASDALRDYLEMKLAGARAGTFTGHVISTLAHDATLSEAERVANLGVVIFAGFETTTGLLSKGVEALLRHPAQWAYLRDALAPDTPIVIDGAPVPDREWRWLSWASGQQARHVDADRKDRLTALCAGSPDAAERAAAIQQQEQLLDAAVEELLRWTAPGTVVPLTPSRDVTLPLESPVTVKGCPYAAGAPLTIKRGETIAVAVDELNRRCSRACCASSRTWSSRATRSRRRWSCSAASRAFQCAPPASPTHSVANLAGSSTLPATISHVPCTCTRARGP
jgi:cytochrome P450